MIPARYREWVFVWLMTLFMSLAVPGAKTLWNEYQSPFVVAAPTICSGRPEVRRASSLSAAGLRPGAGGLALAARGAGGDFNHPAIDAFANRPDRAGRSICLRLPIAMYDSVVRASEGVDHNSALLVTGRRGFNAAREGTL